MTEIYLSRYDRNGSVKPAETVAQDIVDRLLALETGPRGWTAVSRDAIAEIKRLRVAGDALTEWVHYDHRSDRCTGKFASKCVCGLVEHVKAWQDARGG